MKLHTDRRPGHGGASETGTDNTVKPRIAQERGPGREKGGGDGRRNRWTGVVPRSGGEGRPCSMRERDGHQACVGSRAFIRPNSVDEADGQRTFADARDAVDEVTRDDDADAMQHRTDGGETQAKRMVKTSTFAASRQRARQPVRACRPGRSTAGAAARSGPSPSGMIRDADRPGEILGCTRAAGATRSSQPARLISSCWTRAIEAACAFPS